MKRKYGYIGMAVIVLIFGILVIPEIMKRAANGDIVRNESRSISTNESNSSQGEAQSTKTQLAYLGQKGQQKKIPPFSFTDQNGKTITNADYKGKVYLAEFFFTTCPTICPKMNAQLVKIQNDFIDKKDFGIASFSINPSNDTPKVLKEYAEEYGVKDPDWHLMTGDREKIYELANTGFNLYAGVNKEVQGNFQHSGYFALVDRQGYIRSRRDKYGNPIGYYNAVQKDEMQKDQMQMLREDIRKLL